MGDAIPGMIRNTPPGVPQPGSQAAYEVQQKKDQKKAEEQVIQQGQVAPQVPVTITQTDPTGKKETLTVINTAATSSSQEAARAGAVTTTGIPLAIEAPNPEIAANLSANAPETLAGMEQTQKDLGKLGQIFKEMEASGKDTEPMARSIAELMGKMFMQQYDRTMKDLDMSYTLMSAQRENVKAMGALEVEKMKESAVKNFDAAMKEAIGQIVSASVQIAASTASVGMSVGSFKASHTAATKSADATKTMAAAPGDKFAKQAAAAPETKAAANARNNADLLTGLAHPTNTIGGSMGSMMESGMKMASASDRLDAQMADVEREMASQAKNIAQQYWNSLQSDVEKCSSQLSSLMQTYSNIMSSTTRINNA